MPEDRADRVIIFSVILLLAWAIIGLPLFDWFVHYEPAGHAAAEGGGGQNTQTYRDWIGKDAAGFFTAILAVTGVFQLFMFAVQLRFIRKLDRRQNRCGRRERSSRRNQNAS